MLRVPWTARLTNETVMEIAKERREMMWAVRKRLLKFLGHLLRHGCLEKKCSLEEKKDEEREAGRK